MYECFHCGERAVIWGCDYDFDDCGIEGEGIVHELHCSNCGSRITYEVPLVDAEGSGGCPRKSA